VKGGFGLKVPANQVATMTSDAGKNALATTIASKITGVSASDVKVEVTSSRRLTESPSGRRLQSNVQVDYTVSIPDGVDATVVSSDITTGIVNDKAGFATAMAADLQAETGETITVEVTSATTPTVQTEAQPA